MPSPTPRPENLSNDAAERAAAVADSSDNDLRLARRDNRGALPAPANLKLLDRRTSAAREAARREEQARAGAPKNPSAEVRRGPEIPLVPSSGVRRRITALRGVQLALALIGAGSLGLLASPQVPNWTPAAVLCVCVLVNYYLTWSFTRPLVSLAGTARALAMGDYGARATAGDSNEFAEIARVLNALLDERAATLAQNGEQQQRLQNDIHQLSVAAGAAAAGDLSVRAKVQSGSLAKLADELNAALENFAEVAQGTRAASGTMVEALAQVHELANSLTQYVSRQHSGFESSAGVLRHVAERTDAVTGSAQVATDTMRRTTETAQEGGRMVQRLLEGMANVRRGAQGSAAKMKRLGERTLEISTIVGVISRISAQTNMLALNAAIEASRAGEHGLGFTVVADEVRKLAEDCEEATKEIVRLITAIQSETNDAVADLEKQAGQVEQQAQLAGDTGGALERILTVSQQGARLVAEISETAHQQAGDAAGLREAMQNAGHTARDMQAAAERAQKTIETLHATATELGRRVASIRADAGGGDTTSE